MNVGSVANAGKGGAMMVNFKKTLIDRLDHGKTKLPYSVDQLEHMSLDHMQRACRRNGLNPNGKVDVVRARLMGLLLEQKKAGNAYLQKKAMNIVNEINARADEAIEDWGVNSIETENDRNIDGQVFALFDGIDELKMKNDRQISDMKEQEKWHNDFEPITFDTKTLVHTQRPHPPARAWLAGWASI